MTQEEKDLLFKDLCTRLLYNPIVHKKWSYIDCNNTLKYNEKDETLNIYDFYSIAGIKPYLRSMSNMTENEIKEYSKLWKLQNEFPTDIDIKFKIDVIDWLNAHHFDYRGLIEKDLAFEAPKDMYKIN